MINDDAMKNVGNTDKTATEFIRIFSEMCKGLLNARHYEISSLIRNSLSYFGYFFEAQAIHVYVLEGTICTEVIKWNGENEDIEEIGEIVFESELLEELSKGYVYVSGDDSYQECFIEYKEKNSNRILLPMQLFDNLFGAVFIDMGTIDFINDEEAIRMASLVTEIYTSTIDRRARISQLFNGDEIHKIAMSAISEMIITTDKHGKISDINARAIEVLGKENFQVVGKFFHEVIRLQNKTYHENCEELLTHMIVTEHMTNLEDELIIKDIKGNDIIVKCQLSPVYNINSEYFGAVVSIFDVTAENIKAKEIEYISRHDRLTGLYNRAYYEEMLIKLDTDNSYPISAIVGDINGLRLINRAFGKQMGDEILFQVSDAMKKVIKKTGFITRVRGHMFIALLPNTNRERASQLITDMKGYINETNYLPIDISISFGFATKEDHRNSILDIVNLAEDEVVVKKAIESGRARNTIIDTLVKQLMVATHETKEHGDAISFYSEKIAEKMGLCEEDVESLLLLAYTHDLGKVTIPDYILNKKESLTEDEWRILKNHVFSGYQIAAESSELSRVATSILGHHERWDGRGYPQQLKGEAIPLLARIIAVVEAFDAMMTKRVYRDEMSREEAVAEIVKGAGTTYDPGVVEVFQRVLEEE